MNVRGQTAAEVAMARGHHQVGGDMCLGYVLCSMQGFNILGPPENTLFFKAIFFSYVAIQCVENKTKPNGAWFTIVNHS